MLRGWIRFVIEFGIVMQSAVVLRYDVALLAVDKSTILELRIQHEVVSPPLLPVDIRLQSFGMALLAESLIEAVRLGGILESNSFIHILLRQRSRHHVVLPRLRQILILAVLRSLHLLHREVQILQ